MNPTREVYPNAPLQLVAFEVRYPTLRRAGTSEGLDALQAALGERFPIYEHVVESGFPLGPGGPGNPVSTQWHRFLDTSRTASLSVQARRLIVETTQYERFEKFQEIVGIALRALEGADRIPVFERVGLRYIDEVRADVATGQPSEWAPYINGALLSGGGVEPPGTQKSRVEGVVRFDLDRSRVAILRYGNLENEIVGEGKLQLKPNKQRKGPFFLIDIDSFVEGRPGTDAFSAAAVLSICHELHEPVRDIFEKCITKRLQDEVLRKELAYGTR